MIVERNRVVLEVEVEVEKVVIFIACSVLLSICWEYRYSRYNAEC